MAQTIPAATAALITKLKAIRGSTSGHQLNFGGRVYTRLLLPDDVGVGISQAYICVPKIFDRPSLAWGDRHVEIRWQQPIFVFIPEDSTDEREAKSPALVEKAMEDLIESCLRDRELGGAVKDWRLVDGGDAVAGVDPQEHWGQLLMFAELFIIHGLDSL